jgi:hypothetical protein
MTLTDSTNELENITDKTVKEWRIQQWLEKSSLDHVAYDDKKPYMV